MPFVDVVRKFYSIKHDALRVCDLFEETALEDRVLFNDLVKLQFNIDISSLYYQQTQCIAPLDFDFENSIPIKFPGDEIVKIDGQIIDSEMVHCIHRSSISAQDELSNQDCDKLFDLVIDSSDDDASEMETDKEIENSGHELEESSEDRELPVDQQINVGVLDSVTEAQGHNENDVVLVTADHQPVSPSYSPSQASEREHQNIEEHLEQGELQVYAQPECSEQRELQIYAPPNESTPVNQQLASPAVAKPSYTAKSYKIPQYVNPPQEPPDRRNRNRRRVDPSRVLRRTSRSRTRWESSGQDLTPFDLRYVSVKRRRTDDIQFSEIQYQQTIIYVTNQIQTGVHLNKTNVGSHACKLEDYTFVCCMSDEVRARDIAYWLFVQIKDGHLLLV